MFKKPSCNYGNNVHTLQKQNIDATINNFIDIIIEL